MPVNSDSPPCSSHLHLPTIVLAATPAGRMPLARNDVSKNRINHDLARCYWTCGRSKRASTIDPSFSCLPLFISYATSLRRRQTESYTERRIDNVWERRGMSQGNISVNVIAQTAMASNARHVRMPMWCEANKKQRNLTNNPFSL